MSKSTRYGGNARTRKTKAPAVQEDKWTQRARRLRRPGPGIEITISLNLLPSYLVLYRLEPMTRGEVRDFEIRNQVRKPDGILWVKHVPVEQPGKSE